MDENSRPVYHDFVKTSCIVLHSSPTQNVHKWLACIGKSVFKTFMKSKVPKCNVYVWNKTKWQQEIHISSEIFISMLNKNNNYVVVS